MSDGSNSIWKKLRQAMPGGESQPGNGMPKAGKPGENPPRATSSQRARPGGAIDLVLGIDLGTSCTKVVIGDPGWQNHSFAVPFATPVTDIAAWLHPTRFGPEANLKMRLMNDPASPHARDLLACYLAGVITHSRSWFEANRPGNYRQREARWSLNLGFPAKAVNGSTLALAYGEIATRAVALASQPMPPSLDLADRIRQGRLTVEPFIPNTRVNLYPEIAAQLAGYVNSPYRQLGNLLLIDVGAGTLDVSTIILHGNQHQDIVSFHFCEVEELGVLRLHERRVREIERTLPGAIRHPLEHYQTGSRPVPETLDEIVHLPSQDLQDLFRSVSDEFANSVLEVALRCLVRFRTSQRRVNPNPNFDPWGKNLRFFLTGGGGRANLYRRQLVNGPLEDRLAANYTRWHPDRNHRMGARQGLLLEAMPLPENLKSFPEVLHPHFDRLSVAYGLAFGGENLMKITAATHT